MDKAIEKAENKRAREGFRYEYVEIMRSMMLPFRQFTDPR